MDSNLCSLAKLRDLKSIPLVNEDLFIKLIQSYCRDVLADIRGKYSGIPSPAGEVKLDAAEQRAKAKELRDEVENKLIERRKPVGMFYA